jgi:hypothetical protein
MGKHPFRIPVYKLNASQLHVFTNAAILVCTEDSKDVAILHERMERVFRIDANDDIATAKVSVVQLFDERGMLRTTGDEFYIVNVCGIFDRVSVIFPQGPVLFGRHDLKVILCFRQHLQSLVIRRP